jgi:hypothetical protein
MPRSGSELRLMKARSLLSFNWGSFRLAAPLAVADTNIFRNTLQKKIKFMQRCEQFIIYTLTILNAKALT